MEAFDNDLDQYNEDYDNTNTCLECEQPIEQGKDFCSEQCYKHNDL